MKALNLYAVRDLRYDEVPVPERRADEILLRVKAVGICGSDLPRVFEKGTYHFPTIIGHEFAGEVAAAEDTALVGKRAAVFPLVPCGVCSACQTGHYAQCSQYDYYGSRCDGAMAEYIAVKQRNLVFLPDDVPYEAAAMGEPAAVALHAFRKARVGLGQTLVVFGIGPIGLIIAQWARAAGVKNIVLVARSEEKTAFARQQGFMQAINSQQTDVEAYVRGLTAGQGADACIEGTGMSEPLAMCLLCAKNFGVVVTMGNPAGDMVLPQQAYWKILRKELRVVGTWNSSFCSIENDWQDTLAAMENKTIDVLPLITHRYALAEYQTAFALMHEKREFYCKVMFVSE